MEIEVPYDYINYLAFSSLLKYNNTRKININDLNKFRKILLKLILDNYKSRNETIINEDDWEEDIYFLEIDEEYELERFLEEHSDFFYMEDNNICLYKNIDFDTLEIRMEELRIENDINPRFSLPVNNIELLSIIKCSKIHEIYEDYLINKESHLEKAYYNYFYNRTKENERELSKLMFQRYLFYNNISKLQHHFLEAIIDSTESFMYEYDNDYLEKYPLDELLWSQSEFNDEDLNGTIDARIYDTFQYAIFGEKTQVYKKLGEDFNYVSMLQDKEFAIKNESYETAEIIEEDLKRFNDITIFYLRYIANIDGFLSNNRDDELFEDKIRLIYVLDSPSSCLFKKENLEKEIERAKNTIIEKSSLKFIENEIKFMIEDLFLGENPFYINPKLIFIKTYYQITKDEQIIEILNRYSNHENYKYFSNFILKKENDFQRTLK